MTNDNTSLPLLDLADLERVVIRLREAVTLYRADEENTLALDSAIKRFELAYELSTKLLRRYMLETAASAKDVVQLSFQGLIREADDQELVLHGWPEWKRYRDARNETVHTYREEKAKSVVNDAEAFLPEAEYLLDNLKRRTERDG